MNKTVLIFGYGYVSKFLSEELSKRDWTIYCTSRRNIRDTLGSSNIKIINFNDPDLLLIIKEASAIISSVPTDMIQIDPVLKKFFDIILQTKSKWIGYFSSTGVYGNHRGKWVNEQSLCNPTNQKTNVRLLAEKEWLDLYLKYKLPIHIFRLSGIYGPGRNCLEDINKGKDFTIIKKKQYFSRIHVDDICQVIITSLNLPTPGEIYNVSDDEPTPIDVVHQFGANILNRKPLKEVMLKDANLSEQAKIFFMDNKKVSNDKIKTKLLIKLKYPNYKVGLLEGCKPYL